MLVIWPVVDVALHVLSEHCCPLFPIDDVKLGKGLHGNPEGYPPANDGRRVVSKAGDGCSAGFINQKEYWLALLALDGVIGCNQAINERSP